MKCILITTASDINKTLTLQRSLKKYGWDYHIITHEWQGFGDKILKTYEYLKANPSITHFFYSDSYDSIVTKSMEEAFISIKDYDCILMSAERGCYPHPDKEKLYPKHESPFHFVNGGGWFCNAEVFKRAVQSNPLTVNTVDQVWFTNLFLNNPEYVKLDYECNTFQTVAFCPDSDFIIGNTIYNTITNSFPAFIHGNGHTPIDKFLTILKTEMNTLNELESEWQNNPDTHKRIHELLCDKVNAEPKLKALRDYVESNIFGFGERSFYWLFKLIAETQNNNFNFLEIGVFRGQTLALVRTLSPKANIVGITPLDTTNDGVNHHWESDYKADIKKLHDDFKLKQPKIIKGLSTDADVIDKVSKTTWDVIYIDGGHAYEVAKSDIYKYSSFVKVGGYLIIDDCCNRYNLPEGMFRGIDVVSRAVDELLPNDYYKEICSVVHIRVFKKIK
jgi:hypothetical protein